MPHGRRSGAARLDARIAAGGPAAAELDRERGELLERCAAVETTGRIHTIALVGRDSLMLELADERGWRFSTIAQVAGMTATRVQQIVERERERSVEATG